MNPVPEKSVPDTFKDLYYSPNKLLSYNRILNFVIGARGIGKSFAFKEHPIKRFIKHGEQFMYVRRYKDELKKVPNYFDDVAFKFPDHTFKVKGREFYIDNKLAGWAIPLSTWQSLKSNSFPNVTTVIYDEFLREKDNSTYIPNEPEALLNLMDTVFRNRENVRCICMSNAVTLVNPFFMYFKVIPDLNRRYNAYDSIVIEIPDSKDFSEERKKTKFGKLINGTNYGDMSLDNEFVNDSEVFIKKRTDKAKFHFAVVYKGMTIGVWADVEQGEMYLSTAFYPSSRFIYALSKEDMTENRLLSNTWKDNYHLKKMVGAFKNGYLRFENQVLRNTGYEMFQKMNIH